MTNRERAIELVKQGNGLLAFEFVPAIAAALDAAEARGREAAARIAESFTDLEYRAYAKDIAQAIREGKE